MLLSDSQRAALIAAALDVRTRAFAPYSHFLVGAAILTLEGNTHIGCNVENASYGLGICAERSAVSAMVAAGDRKIGAIVVASQGAVTPCGACRQVLAEFGSDFEVLLVDGDLGGVQQTWTIGDLLPGAFRLLRD